jgi:AcrR family transcriptional regulator
VDKKGGARDALGADAKMASTGRRGRRPSAQGPAITLESLTGTLLKLAKQGEIATLTIRRLASELGTSPRLLYFYVQDKDQLFDLLGDAIMAQCVLPSRRAKWSTRLKTLLRDARDLILEYPGVASMALWRSAEAFEAPHASRVAHEIRRILAEAGLEGAALDQSYLVIHSFLGGHMILAEAVEQAERGHTLSEDRSYSAANVRESFERGVEYIVAGIEARVRLRDRSKGSNTGNVIL